MVRFPLRRLLRAAVLAAVIGAGLALISLASADNIDQNNSGARYAWGENIGWLTARPSGEAYAAGGTGAQVTETDVTGYLWGENIGWVNLSCKNDASCGGAAGNWGVKNDGAGNLSGYAWAENAGWINFSCASDASCGGAAGDWGVKISNYTTNAEHAQAGTFSGYAWGENVGWISVSCSNGATCATVRYVVQTGAPDSDGDGYRDATEIGLAKDPFTYCPIMRADLDGNGAVNGIDLALLATDFSHTVPPANARTDQDGNSVVNGIDLAYFALEFLKQVSACS